jgi:hypothetical protein
MRPIRYTVIRPAIVAAALVAAASVLPAHADVVLRYTGAAGSNMSVTLSGGRAALAAEGALILHHRGNDEVVIVDHQKRSYTVIDRKASENIAAQRSAAQAQMAQAMEQMREQLKSLPASQRAAVEQMIKQRTASLMPVKTPARAVSEVGTDTVGEWRCTLYHMSEGGTPTQRMCVVPAADLSMSEDDFETLRATMRALSDMAQRMGGGGPGMGDLDQVNGVPVQIETLAQGRTMLLDGIAHDPVAASAVTIPEGYQRTRLPQ